MMAKTGAEFGGNVTLLDYSQLKEGKSHNEKLFFVVPKKLTEATCSSRLTMAFQVISFWSSSVFI